MEGRVDDRFRWLGGKMDGDALHAVLVDYCCDVLILVG